MILKSCLLPYLDIGRIFYSGANADLKKSLQNVQTKCLRTVYGKKDWPGKETAHSANRILTTKDRQNLHLLKYAHVRSKFRENLRPHHNRRLRSNRKILLAITRPQKNKFTKPFPYQALKLWNSLPENIKRIAEIDNFVTRVKKELLHNKFNFPSSR